MARRPSYHPRPRRGQEAEANAPAPRWDPNWDPKYREARAAWRERDHRHDVNYGAFVARAPARWDHASNWWRKAPQPPQK